MPWLLLALSDSGWLAVVAEVLKETGSGIVTPLVVVAAVGAAFVAAGLVWPRFARD